MTASAEDDEHAAASVSGASKETDEFGAAEPAVSVNGAVSCNPSAHSKYKIRCRPCRKEVMVRSTLPLPRSRRLDGALSEVLLGPASQAAAAGCTKELYVYLYSYGYNLYC